MYAVAGAGLQVERRVLAEEVYNAVGDERLVSGRETLTERSLSARGRGSMVVVTVMLGATGAMVV